MDFISFVAHMPPLILGGLVLGIVGKYIYDHVIRYLKADNKKLVKWDWKGFGWTVLVSLFLSFILYGFVFDKVSELGDSIVILSIAAQTGFFWQSIVGEVGKKFRE